MMNTKEKAFLEREDKSKILINWVHDRLELETRLSFDNVITLSKEQIEDIVIKMKPSNIKMITNFIYVFNLYAKYIGNIESVKIISSIDRNDLWLRIKNSGKLVNRFISNDEFSELIENIEMFEELNSIYYASLLRCIYYGIYSEDMSVLKNLRGSCVDVNNGYVSTKDDFENEYIVKIPVDLACDLVQLSNSDVWYRKNRYGVISINTHGIYPDSCFKIEDRGCGNNYRYSYFSRLRKISNEYLERPLKPMNLYVSGIMYRIKESLLNSDKDLNYAFVEHTRSAYQIIQDELNNSHYNKDTRYFRQMVVGYLNEF